MGRGGTNDEFPSTETASRQRRRSARANEIFDKHFPYTRFNGLPASDLYRSGDVAKRLLNRLGVGTNHGGWERRFYPALQELIPNAAGLALDIGLAEALERAAGLPANAPSFELHLYKRVRETTPASFPDEASELIWVEDTWMQALTEWRADAAERRAKELDWLAHHLRYEVDGVPLSEEQRRIFLTELGLEEGWDGTGDVDLVARDVLTRSFRS